MSTLPRLTVAHTCDVERTGDVSSATENVWRASHATFPITLTYR